MVYVELLRWLHILGATVLIGTGAGIAFFMLMAHRNGRPEIVAHTAGVVVLADWVFTASAVVIQPFSGVALALELGWPLGEPWIVMSFGLYIFIGACWLPVVWMQARMRRLAEAAVAEGSVLPAEYHRLFRRWFALGIPAFIAILALLGIMVTRPGW